MRHTLHDSSNLQPFLFAMPWAEPWHAPLGLSIVARLLRLGGINPVVAHYNVQFLPVLIQKVGVEAAVSFFANGSVGEAVTGHLLRSKLKPTPDEIETLRPLLNSAKVTESDFCQTLSALRSFLDRALDKLDLPNAPLVGISVCINQLAGSLYLADRIKAIRPQATVILGGSNLEDPMGLEILRRFSSVDFIVRGEAEHSILPLFTALHNQTLTTLDAIPCIAFRSGDEICVTDKKMVAMADCVPPDYSEFRRDYRVVEEITDMSPTYYLEASRGCWWGEKHHCKFCGIHTTSIAFREKTADAVLSEVQQLITDYGARSISFADTILSMRHLSSLVPALCDTKLPHPTHFSLDVKSNLRKDQLALLADAGFCALQAGIESFSDRMLQLMDKGSTALQQVQFLKWCSELGIEPFYLLLTNIPGEEPSDYEQMLSIAKAISHLTPPRTVIPVELDRYSPYFERYEEFGFSPPQPAPHYRLMFGGTDVDLHNIAYHFTGYHETYESPLLTESREQLASYVRTVWQKEFSRRSVTYHVLQTAVYLKCEHRQHERSLHGVERDVYLACDRARTFESLCRSWGEHISASDLRRFLTLLCEEGYMVRSEYKDQYLAVACRESREAPQSSVDACDGEELAFSRDEV